MRIAIVAEVYLPKIDGVVIRTMNLIRRLQAAGDEVLVICPQADRGRESPTPVCEFPSAPFPAYPEYRIGVPDARLVDDVREFAPDVVHFLNPLAFGFRCFDLLVRGGLTPPCLFSFHTLYGEFVKQYALLRPLSPLLWWLARSYHNAADANLTVSPIMQAELRRRGFERVALWPPAVDCELFHPGRADATMRDRLSGGDRESPLLITVSRLAPEKNVGFLADVMRRVPQARLAVIGDGPQRGDLERKFDGTRTRFIGYLKGAELAAAYASADAFVYASETETMGNVVLEAMACGLATVAPNAGGIPSLVTDRGSGLLYQPRNISDAVDCIEKLLDRPRYRRRLAESARREAEGRTWEAAAQSVRELYAATIESAVGPRPLDARRRLAPMVVSGSLRAFWLLCGRQEAVAASQSVPALNRLEVVEA